MFLYIFMDVKIPTCVSLYSITHYDIISVLVWALYHIAKNPDVDRKIFEEMKTVLGKNNVDGANITDLV